ncbi:membrane protein involved in the export of O-antigen and teichoic acid [Marinitoga piezophila KA3]|uniref:Membrane protein involved in the export of O-antigen and teichoic acid n=1 Tax=Marinitoga piezophila (strain DSM 14283 / JCM 11233 / KA3) TaxID=443254 RepID=H2J2W5_MARPK|nr:oligosaccharide flippase family protein [Marinitoga piezophila]AEX85656.1 membrane protein involved in the export of O-antigen and teichoic acid [Marinitoga piezophila KA3]
MNKAFINKLSKKGFFHIFFSNVFNKIIQFLTSIVIVKFLTKEEYGIFSYAMNILSLFLILNGLGVTSGFLQFGSESYKDKNLQKSYFKYALTVGILFNFLISFAIFIYSQFFSLPIKGSIVVLKYMSLIPIITIIYELIQTYYRVNLRNKIYSYTYSLNTFLYFILSIIGAYYLKINGIILGRYFAYIIAILFSIWYLKDDIRDIFYIKYPQKNLRVDFFKYSFVSSLTNSISSILYLIDTFLVGLIIKNAEITASYKAATLIPFALNFIPLSVMTFAYPYIVQNNKDKAYLKKYYFKLKKYLLLLNSLISLFLILFAPFIIKIMFRSDYTDSVLPFQILSFGYFIAGSFRIPNGNFIAAIKKLKVNLIVSIISGSANIILDIILIYYYGSTGAAVATVGVFVISSLLSELYLWRYFKK